MKEIRHIKDSGQRTEQVWNGNYNKIGDRRGCTGTHNMSKTVLYKRWTDMKKRCNNKKNKRYEGYGGRGIRVCDEWEHSFEAFYRWATENGYREDLSIDRIDVNGNYEPSNCRWISMSEQAKNTRRNHFLTAHGKTQTISDWARETGINVDVIKDRVNRLNWSDEEAVSIPTLRMGGKRWLVK